MMPAAWYGGNFRIMELEEKLEGKLEDLDEIYVDMNSKDSIYINSNSQLFQNEKVTTKMVTLPEKFEKVGTRSYVHLHFLSIIWNDNEGYIGLSSPARLPAGSVPLCREN